MTDYMHHIPGRMRLRSRLFTGDSVKHKGVLRKLRAVKGVRSVRHNSKASSVTIIYSVSETEIRQIFNLLEGLVQFAEQSSPVYQRHSKAKTRPERQMGEGTFFNELPSLVGKAALNVLVARGVSYSLSSLMSARG